MICMRLPAFLLALATVLLWCSTAAKAADPTNKWSVEIEAVIDSSPAIAPDGTIYFGSWNDRFWALKPDGTQKWVFHAGGEVRSSPAVAADGTVYFGCHDRKLYALQADGKQ